MKDGFPGDGTPRRRAVWSLRFCLATSGAVEDGEGAASPRWDRPAAVLAGTDRRGAHRSAPAPTLGE